MRISPMSTAALRLDDPFVAATVQYFHEHLGQEPRPRTEIRGYLAGGLGVRCFAGLRTTGDIDMFFVNANVLIPPNTSIAVRHGAASYALLFDHQYTPHFGLLHPDYERRAIALSQQPGFLLSVLHPVDLALSKVVRFEDHDREDIKALAGTHSFDAEAIETLGAACLDDMIGNRRFAELNLAEAVALVADAQRGGKDIA